ncbi:hypothetical protein [Ciceribacter sp. L1K22]|uniref:hypothetical protein n=1 Tax=Ciceribacter sp. L1K22 TaxID=2820275 RepID=UPI001ABE36D4|nr:hypothetical protein [Ciceribacter sp. L1K22]MBO3760376.1 hypothetical protein [Ciceribacter sp. L1K22]
MQPGRDHHHPTKPRVTDHAVTRFVQRILDVTLAVEFDTERERAEAHCRAAGVTADDVRFRIWTPGIAAASRMGVERVSNGEFTVAFAPQTGAVMTVMPPRFAVDVPRRMKVRTDKENRRESQKWHRRAKRKPTAAHLAATNREELDDA